MFFILPIAYGELINLQVPFFFGFPTVHSPVPPPSECSLTSDVIQKWEYLKAALAEEPEKKIMKIMDFLGT